MEKPVVDEDLTLRTLVAPLTAVSMGKVTSLSTSSGAIPSASVITTTVGALRSGNTSTSEWRVEYSPATRQMNAITRTASLLLREKRIIPLRNPFSC